MKTIYLFIVLSVFSYNIIHAQNVGIGTATPNANALLHVDLGLNTGKGILVTGTYDAASSTVPDLGAGSRLMFYPGKGAFRAGYVGGTHWNDINVGVFSSALGINARAIGHSSTAIGSSVTASEYASTAIGYIAAASGMYSMALGSNVTASGSHSTAMGIYTTAGGNSSTALGYFNIARGFGSTVLGMYNDPILGSDQSGNATSQTPLFIIGNGNSTQDRNNAMVVRRTGNVGIGSNADVSSAILDVSSTSQGMLIPRMTRASRDAISSPATSLLIYQTNETPGFVYNAGSTLVPNWVRMSRRLDTLVVGAHAFMPMSSNVAYATNAWSVRYIPTDGNTSPLFAPVSLPAGVTITTMKVYYLDESASANLKVSLYKNFLTVGSVSETAFAFTSSSSSSSIRTGTINSSHVVANNEAAYHLAVIPAAGSWNSSADIAIKGVMIIYEY